jgi:hypothetical protein
LRAELARKVAQLWERELGDPREAADAWRRVLRMKPGDPEATAGLEGAKANMLRRPIALPESDEPVAPATTQESSASGGEPSAEAAPAPEAPAPAEATTAEPPKQSVSAADSVAAQEPPTGGDEAAASVQEPEPEVKRSGRRRRRSTRPEAPELPPAPQEVAPSHTEADVSAVPPDLPSSPATLVDPQGPAGEPLFTSSEPHLQAAVPVAAPPPANAQADTLDVDVSIGEEGAGEEIAFEEVAEVIESVDAPIAEPMKPKRSIPPPLPAPASVRPRQEK